MNLELVCKDNVFYADSREVAKLTGKRHDHLVRDIDSYVNIINQNPKLGADEHLGQNPKLDSDNFFVESSYTAGTGKAYKCYLLTKKGCDMVANKMTGEKGILFTATYVDKFYEMEHQLEHTRLNHVNVVQHISDREIQLEEKKLALEEKKFLYESWLKLSSLTEIPEYKQISQSYAANTLADKEVFALPQVTEKTYTATEVGEMLGISANKVGKLAKGNNLKTEQYGKWFYDKSKYSGKQVESFRYNQAGVEAIRAKLNDSGNHGKIIGYEPYGGSDKLVALVQK